MLFKNAIVFRLTDGPLSHAQLEEALQNFPHRLPEPLDPMTYGFVPPLGEELLVETVNGVSMIATKRSWRDLPNVVIREKVNEKAEAIKIAEGRVVGRKERESIRDEVIFDLLPKAFVKHRVTHAMFIGDWIVVNASSTTQAEDLISKLREALGSLKCLPLQVNGIPEQVMTHWISAANELDERISLEDTCTLEDSNKKSNDKRVVRVKGQDLYSSEVSNHVNSGLSVSNLRINVKDVASFDIDRDLRFKRIKFDDIVSSNAVEHAGDASDAYNKALSEMIVSADALETAIDLVLSQMGGEDR